MQGKSCCCAAGFVSVMHGIGQSKRPAQRESCPAVPVFLWLLVYSLFTIQVPAIMIARAMKNSMPGISRKITKDSSTPMKGATA